MEDITHLREGSRSTAGSVALAWIRDPQRTPAGEKGLLAGARGGAAVAALAEDPLPGEASTPGSITVYAPAATASLMVGANMHRHGAAGKSQL
jgi:hypothetical protein